MKSVFVLALSCGALLLASYARADGTQGMGRTSRDAQIIVSNIVNVIRQLAELVIPETAARQTLREAMRLVTTCLRKADGLELVFIREFIAGIPTTLDCVEMVFKARNRREQKKATKCFVRRILMFQKKFQVPMDQVKKVGDSIACLKESFLM